MDKPSISKTELAKHTGKADLWIALHGKVYSVGAYLDEHPGGEEIIESVGGTDATEHFDDVGHSEDAIELMETFCVGRQAEYQAPVAKIPFTSTPAMSLPNIKIKSNNIKQSILIVLSITVVIVYLLFVLVKRPGNPLDNTIRLWRIPGIQVSSDGSGSWKWVLVGLAPGAASLGYVVYMVKESLEVGLELEHFKPYLEPQVPLRGPPRYNS